MYFDMKIKGIFGIKLFANFLRLQDILFVYVLQNNISDSDEND